MAESSLPPYARSITEGWVALDHFTDRHDAVRRFADYLHIDPAPDTVLFFHGVGGNGKTVLTRFLHERATKRLSDRNWAEARAKTGDAFVRYLSQADPSTNVPSARIDLRNGAEDVVNILLRVSRQLAAFDLRFPVFTYSCVQYWRSTHQYSPDFVKHNFPEDELEFVSALVDDLAKVVPGASVGVALLKCVNKHLGAKFDDYFKRRQIDTEVVDAMARWEPSELLQKLPAIFAADLNAAMTGEGAPRRVVLSFDTYERFWGEPRNVIPDQHPERDVWLRGLLTSLDRTKGIVTVVAGRERPWWVNSRASDIPLVEPILVGEFADADAADYLAKLSGPRVQDRARLIELARVGPDRVHPLLLGLAADIAIAGSRQGLDATADLKITSTDIAVLGRRLLDHLLKYVDDASRYALRALAACRRFDFAIYCYLGETSGFEARARFDALTQFSFIQPSGQGKAQSFEMHELLRRLFRDEAHEVFAEAHRKMEGFHRARVANGGDDADTAIVEAIYHANQLDADRGLDEWVLTLDDAVGLSNYGRCRLLTDLLPDLTIEADWWRGRVFQATGDFVATLSAHAEALAAYEAAVSSYDAGPDLAPNNPQVLKNKGDVLKSRGDLLASFPKTDEALATYDAAVASYAAALDLLPRNVNALSFAPGYVHALKKKGDVLARRGDLLASLRRSAEALATFDAAIASFDAARNLAPDDPQFLHNMGNVLQSRGDLLASLGCATEALATFDAAIASFDAARNLAPDVPQFLNNKGNVRLRRGKLLASLSDTSEALVAYDAAVSSFDAASTLAPNDAQFLTNKGDAHLRLGDLFASLGDISKTLIAYNAAVTSFDAALAFAPNYVDALTKRGYVLARRGHLLASLGESSEAMVAYDDGVASFDAALALAPKIVSVRIHKGDLLKARGDLLIELSDTQAALAAYDAAVSSYDAALARVPRYATVRNSKGNVLQRRGKLLATLDDTAGALAAFDAAVSSYDAALARVPNDPEILSNKGNVLARRGHLLASLKRSTNALAAYDAAVVSFDAALALAPNCGKTLGAQGLTRLRRALLSVVKKQASVDSARQDFVIALELFERAHSIAPDNLAFANLVARTKAIIKDVCD